MHCPVCGHDNLIGAEVCDNCGADLAGHDVPQATTTFHGRLLGEHLDELGAPAPLTVGPDTPVDVAVERMQATGADCVVACDAGCLMQMGGGLSRRGSRVRAVHLAQVLDGGPGQ